MEDVIFAGTSGRAAARAAPRSLLTIDNTDGALPIDYTEVTISRTMFRSGGSEYAINGTPCRLLDVQELLSDSGIGREMHVIVGQGQLDTILHATPGGPPRLHRGGRRRPQAPQAQGEGAPQARRDRRQPDPARRPARRDPPPAQAARPPGRGGPPRGRSSRPTSATPGPGCIADDLVTARTALEQELADESILVERRRRRSRPAGRAGPARPRRELEAALREDLPALARAQETWFALSGLRERLRGTAVAGRRAGPQRRRLPSRRRSTSGVTPTSSRPRPPQVREQEAAIAAEVEAHRAALEAGGDRPPYRRGRGGRGGPPGRRAAARRRRPSRGAGPARRPGQRRSQSRAAAADDEIGRLDAGPRRRRGPGRPRPARLHRARDPGRRARRRRGGPRRRARGRACAVLDDLDGAAGQGPRGGRSSAERDRAALQAAARRRSSSASTARTAPARCWPRPTRSPGLLGSVAALLTVDAGYETAVAAALGSAADAVAVDRRRRRRRARSTTSRTDDLGRAGLLLGGGRRPTTERLARRCPTTRRTPSTWSTCPDDRCARRWRGCSFKTAVVDDLDAARRAGRRRCPTSPR